MTVTLAPLLKENRNLDTYSWIAIGCWLYVHWIVWTHSFEADKDQISFRIALGPVYEQISHSIVKSQLRKKTFWSYDIRWKIRRIFSEQINRTGCFFSKICLAFCVFPTKQQNENSTRKNVTCIIFFDFGNQVSIFVSYIICFYILSGILFFSFCCCFCWFCCCAVAGVTYKMKNTTFSCFTNWQNILIIHINIWHSKHYVNCTCRCRH